MDNNESLKKPILFACSGCSNAGRAAYDVALDLDRRGVAEMSCLAGVAAEKKTFMRKIENRDVWVIDGCPIHCSLGVFERIGRDVNQHFRLHDLGVKKNGPPTGNIDTNDLADQLIDRVDKCRTADGEHRHSAAVCATRANS